MPKLFFKVVGGLRHNTLVPSDQPSINYLNKQKLGTVLRCDTKRPRNPKHHRKMFALLKVVHQGTELQDRYPHMDNLLDALKHALGHVETFISIQGDVLTKPKSISFESMGQDEFEEFYDAAVEIITSRLIPHLDKAGLEAQVNEILLGTKKG